MSCVEAQNQHDKFVGYVMTPLTFYFFDVARVTVRLHLDGDGFSDFIKFESRLRKRRFD